MKVLTTSEIVKRYSKLSYHERIIISEIMKSYTREENTKIVRFPGNYKNGDC